MLRHRLRKLCESFVGCGLCWNGDGQFLNSRSL